MTKSSSSSQNRNDAEKKQDLQPNGPDGLEPHELAAEMSSAQLEKFAERLVQFRRAKQAARAQGQGQAA